jgi:hypothetical protein
MNGSAGHIAELARASNQFKNIKLSERLKDLVGFAWDGQHLSINSNGPAVVNYRIDVNGGKATVIRSARLLGARWVYEFTLYKHQLIGPDISGYVYLWKYPRAAEPVKEIGYLQTPEGSAISLAP